MGHFYKNVDARLTEQTFVFLLEISNMKDQDTLWEAYTEMMQV